MLALTGRVTRNIHVHPDASVTVAFMPLEQLPQAPAHLVGFDGADSSKHRPTDRKQQSDDQEEETASFIALFSKCDVPAQ